MSSQDATKKSKKRKSMAAGPSGSSLRIEMEEASSSAGPAFLDFPAVRPADHVPFTMHTLDVGSDKDVTQQSTVIAGETADVEFTSSNRNFRKDASGGMDVNYFPAIYDPSTSTLHVHPSTPLYLMSHCVKRLRVADEQRTAPTGEMMYRAQRNALGDAFGTKKAKSQIRAEERNKVDTAAMEGVKGHLMGSIMKREEAVAGPPENIPAPNLTTPEPMAVYSRQSLIPDEQWDAISVSALMKAGDDASRAKLLPYARAAWMQGKMRVILGGPAEERKTKLRYLIYLCALYQLYFLAPKLHQLTPVEIQTKMRNVPPQVLSGLLAGFTQQSGKKYSVTDKTKTKLWSWICCLHLVIEGGSAEVARVASDLGLAVDKLTPIFKSLGCSVDLASVAERESSGMSLEEAKKRRRAVLKAPVVFPKPKSRAGPRR